MTSARRAFLKDNPTPPAQSAGWGRRMARAARWTGRVLFLGLCAAATAWLLKLSYPKPSYSLLAWLALAPFALAVMQLRGFWSSFWYGWLTGVLVYGALYYWIFITCLDGGGLGFGLALAAWLGLSALMALQMAIFGGSCYFLKRLQWIFPILAAMGWAALEWAHEMLATYALGFPWFTLAYSQWNLPQILQLAPLTGAAGISCLVAFTGLSVGYAFGTPYLRRGIFQLLLAGLVFWAAYSYGDWVLAHQPGRTLLRLRAAVMQPNIDQYKKWDEAFEQEIEETISALSAQLAGEDVMLTVWPESITPGPATEEPYRSWMEQAAMTSGAWQLAGTNRERNGRNYVSAVLFSPDGEESGFYDKTHLVPFGEFIPLEPWVRKAFPQVEVLGELGSFSPGGPQQPLLRVDQILFGGTICYESLFSQLWREQVRSGARFFVNITNDAWFFDTDAPYQHLAVSVLRAAETHRPVLRAANTGISAVIAPTGEILDRAELNTRAVLLADVPLPVGEELSFYSRWGDWFAWLCAAVYFSILLSVMVFAYE